MSNIEEEVCAALEVWDKEPSVVQIEKDERTTTTTSRELSEQIEEIAKRLYGWGIREKYLVPIFLRNSTDFIKIFLSLLRIKAIPVMVKMEYRTMELAEVFCNAQPEAIIAEKEHLRFLKPYLQNTLVIARAENRLSLEQSADHLQSRKDIPDDIASINYTDRGYGYPLGVMISHAQYLHGARVLQDTLKGAAGEKMLVILPMAHIFTIIGCILAPLLYGITSVVVDTMHPRRLFQYIRDFQIEHITSVPEIYELLYRLRDPTLDLPSLKVFVSGGSLLTPDNYANITEAFSVDLLHGYGLTEFTPVSGNIRHEARPGTVGPLCDQVECRIDALTPDGVGEIMIRTPHETGVYYRRVHESNEAHRDGWFRTGDLGFIDQGHLVFKKELKNTRKINGNLVDLEEVCRAIRLDNDVAEARVEWDNNSLVADLAVNKGIDFDEKTKWLKSSLRGILAEYKVPRRFNKLS